MVKIVVVLAGCAGAGKDTFAGFLAKRLAHLQIAHRLDAYAWTLKQIAHLKYGIPLNILHADKIVKESTYFYSKSVRKILQEEGEYARQTCGKTVWADRVFDRLKADDHQVVVVTDGRHPNEEIVGMRERIEALEGTRYFAVRVRNSRVPIIRGHPSEDLIADAPDSIFDLLIENEGNLDDLERVAVDAIDAMLVLDQAKVKKISTKLTSYSVGADGWPYHSREDAETLARNCPPGKQIVARNFMHLKGPLVSSR
jgi:tRNA A37 threonylcarbamoyladenosine biosynthesis protein TsaE